MSCPSTILFPPRCGYTEGLTREMATHQCLAPKEGHRAAHYCGCGYEWTDETRRVLLDDEGGHDD